MKSHHLTAKSIYHAFLELTEKEKKQIAEKILNLFRREPASDKKGIKGKDKWHELEKLISPMRKGLPADYKFDREEANAR